MSDHEDLEKLSVRSKSPIPVLQKFNDKIQDLNKKRGTIRGRLTLFTKFVTSLISEPLNDKKLTELKLRSDIAKSLMQDFNCIQSSIEELVSEKELSQQIDIRESFENSYYTVFTEVDCLLQSVNNPNSAISDKSRCNSNPLVKLPTIALPLFDGSYNAWLEFRDTYLSLIHKSTQLDDIQKFHYLRSALTGNASHVIKSLEFSSENYIIAWDLLNHRFNNSNLLVHNHVKALFSLQSMSKESPHFIRKLIDIVLKNLRALKTLGEPTEWWDTLIIFIIVSKLDLATEKEWEQHKSILGAEKASKLTHLLDFLTEKANMLEMVQANHSLHPPVNKSVIDNKLKSQKINSFASTHNSNQNNHKFKRTRDCVVCNGNHSLYACTQFLKLSVKDRLDIVNKNSLCANCLRKGHAASDCYFGPCKQCNIKHNSLLHGESSKVSVAISEPSDSSAVLQTQTYLCSKRNNKYPIVKSDLLDIALLSTAIIEVAGNDNKYHKARALLDSGSQHTIISESLRNKLNSKSIQSAYQIVGVGQSVSHSAQLCEIKLRSLNDNNFHMNIKCLVLPTITDMIPTFKINSNSLNIPNGICLADPTYCTPSNIDLLLGVDHFWDLLIEGRIRLSNGPYLQNTKLGWIVAGPIHFEHRRIIPVQCNLTHTLEIGEQLRKFWEIEEVSCQDNLYSQEDRACEKLFIDTTKRLVDGRFSVRIPFKDSIDKLGDSYEVAKSRFLSLERKLERNSQYKQMYNDFMKEYLRLGHMTRVEHCPPINYFLPHHGVFREDSVTTKLRVVFNASQPTSSGKSLNDLQMTGPPLQNDLFAILLRFRQYDYVACGDIEKMFRQVLIQDDQRHLQMIIWRENPSEPLSIFQLNTVSYGNACAPYLSMRCIRQLGYECIDADISRTILNDMYVDDCIFGHDNKMELIRICKGVIEVCKSGCFPLRKWVFNSNEIAKEIVQSDDSQSKHFTLNENCSNKTLGLGWLNNSDEFHFTTKIKEISTPITKRLILSVVSQIYDPLGLLSPVIIKAKVLLQKLWLCKLDWDDIVPLDIKHEWEKFITSLSALHEIRVPRHIICTNPNRIELHIFSDASEVAYGACAYARSISETGDVTVRLISSKTKLAPVKPHSIPRLELCSVLVGSILLERITKAVNINFSNIVCWTDSTIVLGWLKMSPRQLKPFVQHRVVKISDICSDKTKWLHVNGKQNPADILSRGASLDDLMQNEMWWNGPSFLLEKVTEFHTFNTPHNFQDSLPELRTKQTVMACSNSSVHFDFEFKRFSSFYKLQRAYAFVLRFIHNIKLKNKLERLTGPLSVKELNNSLNFIIKTIQLESFANEHHALVNNLPIKSTRNLLSLNLFLDDKGIIRVGGRLSNSPDFSYNKKHPMLLCGKHYVTQLIFEQGHLRLLHAGPQQLLAHIRETWWPLCGRNLARKVVQQCKMCTRMKGETVQPIMGNLPPERITIDFAFNKSGVDYAGPYFILNRKGRGSKLEKCYLCLFVCFATKALHLELVTNLTSEYYILALKRFISRRGKPQCIFSDHGRNFVGAKRELTTFLSRESQSIIDYASSNGIDFKFIPPYAPHFGGLWEAGVKSCKHHITRVLGNSHLTYEEFSTVLAQVEAVLNSRPMYCLSPDPSDYTPLTPAHFLIGRPLTSHASEDVTSTPIHALSRYKRMEQLRQHFWRRWSAEYIGELQTRTKWKESRGVLAPNTLVLIKEDNLPPLKWRLGRILSVFPGKDGVPRVASIQTAYGVIERAFSKICPLPVSTSDDDAAAMKPVQDC